MVIHFFLYDLSYTWQTVLGLVYSSISVWNKLKSHVSKLQQKHNLTLDKELSAVLYDINGCQENESIKTSCEWEYKTVSTQDLKVTGWQNKQNSPSHPDEKSLDSSTGFIKLPPWSKLKLTIQTPVGDGYLNTYKIFTNLFYVILYYISKQSWHHQLSGERKYFTSFTNGKKIGLGGIYQLLFLEGSDALNRLVMTGWMQNM